MRFINRALTGLFLLSVTLGCLAFAGLSLRSALQERAEREPGAAPRREQVVAANVVTVAPETIVPTIESFGRIEARRALDLRAPATGRIARMEVNEGSVVAAGDVLFALDPADAERALVLVEADLADAQAELEDALAAEALAGEDVEAARAQADLRRRALDRQRDLTRRGVGTEAAVEEAELATASAEQQTLSRRQALQQATARVAAARSTVTRAGIGVDEAQRRLDDMRIVAEFDGVISDLSVAEGGLVSANEQLARLIDPDRLEIAFNVTTTEYARLAEDGRVAVESAVVSLDVGGFSLSSPAEITREAAAVGDGETGRQLFARLLEPEGFRPGDFARIRLSEPPLTDVARLPASALGPDDSVLFLGDDERLELASVTRLRDQGDTYIVRAPELAGAEIVATRSPLLGPGIKVRPLRQADSDAQGDEPAEPDLVDLTPERRAELIALVEGNAGMPANAKERVIAALRRDRVPARIVERVEGARGG